MTDSATEEVASAGGSGISAAPVEQLAPGLRSAPGRVLDTIGWHRIRVGAFVGYLAVMCLIIVTTGVPTGRRAIAMMTVAGLATSRLGHGWRSLGRVVLDWLPFTIVLMAYDKTRGLATSVGLPVHESDVIGWERALFGGHVPTVWLQQHLYDPHHVFWYDALFSVTYCTHFLATPLIAALLWLRDRVLWLQYIARVIMLSVAGLVTYVLFPEAPPWLAAQHGALPAVARLSGRGFVRLGAPQLQQTLDHALESGGNQVAAMPSLHVGFACLIAIFVAGKVRRRWWPLLWSYPALMGLALVYLGEHYVVDLLAGLGYALATHFALLRWERRRAARRADRVAAQTRPATA